MHRTRQQNKEKDGRKFLIQSVLFCYMNVDQCFKGIGSPCRL